MWWRYQVGDGLSGAKNTEGRISWTRDLPMGSYGCGSKLINLAMHACHVHTMYCELFKLHVILHVIVFCFPGQPDEKIEKRERKAPNGTEKNLRATVTWWIWAVAVPVFSGVFFIWMPQDRSPLLVLEFLHVAGIGSATTKVRKVKKVKREWNPRKVTNFESKKQCTANCASNVENHAQVKDLFVHAMSKKRSLSSCLLCHHNRGGRHWDFFGAGWTGWHWKIMESRFLINVIVYILPYKSWYYYYGILEKNIPALRAGCTMTAGCTTRHCRGFQRFQAPLARRPKETLESWKATSRPQIKDVKVNKPSLSTCIKSHWKAEHIYILYIYIDGLKLEVEPFQKNKDYVWQ